MLSKCRSFIIIANRKCVFSASQIWELAEGKSNTMELAEAIDSSDLEAFGFTDDFIFELWGAITGQASRNITSMETAKILQNNIHKQCLL
jgi:hypothetical protein